MAVSKWFDANVYLANKVAQLKTTEPSVDWTIDKVVQAFAANGFVGEAGAEAHFMQFGQFEDVAPNAFFNPTEYYRAKAAEVYKKLDNPKSVTDTEAAFVKAAIKGLGMGAWTHYDTFGSNEKVNPSNGFDTEKYMNAKLTALNANLADGQTPYKIEDVYSAFKAAGVNALEHFMLFGGNGKGEVGFTYDPKNPTIPAEFSVNPEKQVNSGGTSGGETFVLTAGMDLINPKQAVLNNGTIKLDYMPGAGNDTFNAYSDGDLKTHDQLDGGAGVDTLNFAVTAGATGTVAVKPLLSNIEIVNATLTGGANTTDATFDASMSTGIKEVWSVNSVGSTANNGVSSLIVQGIKTDVLVGIEGGKLAASPGNLFADHTFKFSDATTTADKATLALKGAKANVVNVDHIENLTINAMTGDSVLADLQAGTDQMKTITVVGDGSVKVTGAVDTSVTSIDASTKAKGGVSFNVDGAAGITSVKGGAGDDTFLFGAQGVKSTTVVGGDGNDTIGVNHGKITELLGSKKVSGVETLKIEDAFTVNTATPTINAIDLSKLEGLKNITFGNTLAVNSGAPTTTLTIDKLANEGILRFDADVTQGTAGAAGLIVNVAGAAQNDNATINVVLGASGAGQTIGGFTIADVENLNIDVKSTSGTATITDLGGAQVEHIKITSSAVGANGKAADASAFTFTDADTTALKTIDLSEYTTTTSGVVDITGLSASLVGTSTTITGPKQGILVATGGAGSDTIITGKNGSNSSTGITGGLGADKIDLSASDAAQDLITIAKGDSKVAAFDTIKSFQTAAANADKLDLENTATAIGAKAEASITGVTGLKASIDANSLMTFGGTATNVSLDDKVKAASQLIDTTQYAAVAFEHEQKIYVFQNNDSGAAAITDNDILVELTGITGVKGVNTSATDGMIWIA